MSIIELNEITLFYDAEERIAEKGQLAMRTALTEWAKTKEKHNSNLAKEKNYRIHDKKK